MPYIKNRIDVVYNGNPVTQITRNNKLPNDDPLFCCENWHKDLLNHTFSEST